MTLASIEIEWFWNLSVCSFNLTNSSFQNFKWENSNKSVNLYVANLVHVESINSIQSWSATWPRFWLQLTSFARLRWATSHRLQCIWTLYMSHFSYACKTEGKKWNFLLNFRTMHKLSDLYSGIFQNYWLFNHLDVHLVWTTSETSQN